ncbi:MAG TPA: lysylphosphatidylglycerol synthase transmembrane domain-containing protein [Pedococcus sp.]
MSSSPPGTARSNRHLWSAARALGVAAVFGVLVWRLGAGPFLDGLRRVDLGSLAAASGIAVVTTLCCAWRWTLVARGLGVVVPLRSAVAAYYRSQFLNVATPGGILGDVHRGVRHGRDVGDTSRALRSVVWERFAGLSVFIALAGFALLLVPSPVALPLPVVGAVALAACGVLGLLALGLPSRPGPRWARPLRRAGADLRAGVLSRHTWPGILLASAVAAVGHVATFLIAARVAGSSASPRQVLPLALLAILAMGLPLSVAGWGPREGTAAWAFAAGGLGAEVGVAASVAYGVMVFVATLPGAVLLVSTRLRRGPAVAGVGPTASPVAAAGSPPDGAAHA